MSRKRRRAKPAGASKKKGKYLFNAFARAKVFRARFLDALGKSGLGLAASMPGKWVVHCEHERYLHILMILPANDQKSLILEDGVRVGFEPRFEPRLIVLLLEGDQGVLLEVSAIADLEEAHRMPRWRGGS